MRFPVGLALVAVGGAVGSALRATVAMSLPGHPLGATLAVNVVGAYLLGFLLDWLAASDEQSGERRRVGIRLLVGTGVCGGFTTYSAVAEQVAELLGGGEAGSAVAYAVGTLVLGAVATLAGVATAALVIGRSGSHAADSTDAAGRAGPADSTGNGGSM